jgi:hypothetical protein
MSIINFVARFGGRLEMLGMLKTTDQMLSHDELAPESMGSIPAPVCGIGRIGTLRYIAIVTLLISDRRRSHAWLKSGLQTNAVQ